VCWSNWNIAIKEENFVRKKSHCNIKILGVRW